MNDFHNDDNDDSLEVGSKTWHRLIDNMNKVGYRDGIDEGSQSVLQADFDKGYIDGFKVAYILGKYKSLANFELNNIQHPKYINDILEKNKRGICHICEFESTDEIINNDSEIIIKNHLVHVSRTLHTLYSYFYPLLKNQGIDISNLKYE